MVVLILSSSGQRVSLAVGDSKAFGRADYTGRPEDRRSVSRQQFFISVTGSACFLTSGAAAPNPTKVLRADGGAVLLDQGQQAALHNGDAVLLHALDSSQRVTVAVAKPELQHDEADEPLSHRQKRLRAARVLGSSSNGTQANGVADMKLEALAAPPNLAGPAQVLPSQQAQQPQPPPKEERPEGSGSGGLYGLQGEVAASVPPEPGPASAPAALGAMPDDAAGRELCQRGGAAPNAPAASAGPASFGGGSTSAQPLSEAHMGEPCSAPARLHNFGSQSQGNGLGSESQGAAFGSHGHSSALGSEPAAPAGPSDSGAGQPLPQGGAALQTGAGGASGAGPSQDGAAAAAQLPAAQEGPASTVAEDQAQAGPSQQPGPPTAVMLVLVGVQGSGKSTFSLRLMGSSDQPWQRVNQDTVNSGKKGTKEMCLAQARAHLAAGRHVIIDRTNIDPAQRQAFVELAQQCGAEAHCLVLRLPVKTCMARAAERQNHEGGLQGKGVYAAINIMHSAYVRAGPPTVAEGFRTILVCENDAEVQAALQAWSTYGTTHRDPLGAWRQLAPPRKEPLPAAAAAKPAGKGKGKAAAAAGAVKPGGKGSIESFFKKKPGPQPGSQLPGSQSGSQPGSQLPGSQLRSQQPGSQLPGPQLGSQQPGSHLGSQTSGGGGGHGALGRQPSQLGGSLAESEQQQQQQEEVQEQRVSAAAKSDAFQLLMASAKKRAEPPVAPQQATQAGPGPSSAAAAAGGQAGRQRSRHTHFNQQAFWARALVEVAARPEKSTGDPAFRSDDRCVRISDKFPKARFHALVIAREPRLRGPLDLATGDAELVEHMVAVGREWAERQRYADGGRPAFYYGFHSVPSLQQLHLHVISQDMDSASLKHKKHWLSYRPPFFLPAAEVLAELRGPRGRLEYSLGEREALLKGPLHCHRCGREQASIGKLKEHIQACRQPAGE